MSDNVTPEITDAEIEEFIDHGGEAPDGPSFHTILEVWREVLKPAAGQATEPVTPAWANRIIASYQGVTYADMVRYQESYFGKIGELVQLLLDEIASDEECLNHLSPEEDAEHNAHHYKNLLLQWQLAITQWELDWDTLSPDAAIEVAAISEVHKMFFGQTGLTQFLDNIQLEFTEADQAQLAEALQALRDGRGE
jgi:hypothetical protein